MDRTLAGWTFHNRVPGVLPVLGILAPIFVLPSSVSCQIQPIELDGIIVTGTPVPRAVGTEGASITILDGEELRARGVFRVVEALSEVPGLVLAENGSYGSVASIFFRGAESDHVKVLMDGIEVNQAGGSFDFSNLLLSDVERIEVARGPGSALYGSDAMAGVINILTRRGRGSPAASISVGAGSFGRREWSAGIHGGSAATSYSLSASHMSSDGILEFNNQFKTTSVSGSVLTSPNEKTRLALNARYTDKAYHFPTDGSGNVVDQNAFTYGDEMILGLEASRMLSDRLEFRGVVRGYGWEGGSDDEPDGPEDTVGFFGYTSLETFKRMSADLRVNLDLLSFAVASAGFEVEGEDQRSFSESLSEFGPSFGRSHHKRSNRGYYAHLTAEGATWSGNLGARVENNQQYGTFLTYQAALSYRIASTGTRIRGSLGRGLKEPTFFETYATGFTLGNPDLDPERSRAWDVGLEQNLGAVASLSVTWFDQSLEDLIQYTFTAPEPGDPNFFNVASARSRGLEVSARISLRSVLVNGGYTYLNTEVLDSGFDDGEGAVFVNGESLIRRPRHQGTLGISYRSGLGSFFGNMRVVGSRDDRDFSAWPAVPVELSRFILLGVGAEILLVEPAGGRPGFSLQIRAENLLDEEYQEVFGFRAPGRALVFGGRFQMGGGD